MTIRVRVFFVTFLLTIGGCAHEWDMTVKGKLKYHIQCINASGRVILSGTQDRIVVSERYLYFLPSLKQLHTFSPDTETAIRAFLDYRGAAPAECLNGFDIVHWGLNEGGSTYASLVCKNPQPPLPNCQ